MTTAIRVLAVDGDPGVRSSIRAMLPAIGFECVGVVASAGEAYARWPAEERVPADVVLVDRFLPDEDGLALCLWLSTRAPAPAVVVLARSADPALALPALVAGASGLLDRRSLVSDLRVAVGAAAAGIPRFPPSAAQVPVEQSAVLAAEDLPIVGMLRHGVPTAEIAATLGIDPPALVARRWAMLEELTAAAGPPVAPRRVAWPAAKRLTTAA